MIRFTRHINTDYIIIDGTIEVDEYVMPVQVQVNINNIKAEDRSKVFRIVGVAFNRNISFNRPKQQPKKPWWKVW